MKQNKNTSLARHHYIRTVIASIFGTIAIWLILASVIVVWLNRTLTDTNTYVSTVAPVVTKPALQNFFSEKLSEQIYKNNSIEDVATTLLPATETTGKSPEELKTATQQVIDGSIKQVLGSSDFMKLWQDTNRTAHEQLLAQIKADAPDLKLDLSPALQGLTTQLKQTGVAPVVDKLSLDADAGKVDLKGNGIEKVHSVYKSFQQATILLLILMVLVVAISVGSSVHHAKTVRRILLSTGISLLLLGLLIQFGSLLRFGGADKESQRVGLVLAQTLLHNLKLASLIGGGLCVAGALASKMVPSFHRKSR